MPGIANITATICSRLASGKANINPLDEYQVKPPVLPARTNFTRQVQTHHDRVFSRKALSTAEMLLKRVEDSKG